MDLKHDYERALSYDQYVDLLEENQELHLQHYKKFSITEEMAEQLKNLQPVKILVLTEPWCGDSLALFPVVYKTAEFCNWPLKVLTRDDNLELMEHFLTNNSRAVPIFLFMNQEYRFQFRFGPRPKAAQDIFETHRQDINDGKIEKIEVIKKIRNFYAKDRGKAIFQQLMETIEQQAGKS